MTMRATITLIFFASALNLLAQFPPIDLEWSALRPYPSMYGANTHISRDDVHGNYVWAVQGTAVQTDEVRNVFLPDGTDVTPLFPYEFSVGSLDYLTNLCVHDSVLHTTMFHMNIGGNPQDIYWHLDGTTVQTDGDGYLNDRGDGLLVTDDAVYGCGNTDTSFQPPVTVARALKQDLQGNVQWNVTWSDPTSSNSSFSSLAVIGDTVICAAYPNLVLLDDNTGVVIDVLEFNPPVGGQLVARGTRIYWGFTTGTDIRFGYYDLVTGSGLNDVVPLSGLGGQAHIVMDDQDRLWIGTTVDNNQGQWFRLDSEFTQVDSGTLYASIDDMCFVNGKISFTGILDPESAIAYVITGTPQP